MPKKQRRAKQQKPRPNVSSDSNESRASETVTIAWTSTVTGVLVADLIVIAAHLYGRANPDARASRVLEAIMLLSAAAMGAISLALLLTVWKTRAVKPPWGYTVFAFLIAAAPIVALLGRLLM